MEFTAAASKRLREYAFLPSKKAKKYTEVHSLYVKGGHSYLQQALTSPTPSTSFPLFSLAGESFSSAALVATRKLRSSPSSLCAYIEATLAYSAADECALAYEALRKAMEQREICVQRCSPVPPSASPTSPRSRPQALDKARLKNRRSSDAGPIRDSRRGSQSVPASPTLSSRTPPAAAITAPGSPQGERDRAPKGGGVFSRMRKLMVRTEKEKAAGKEAKTVTLTDVSPIPPLLLPVPVAPSSPNPLLPPRSTSPFPAPPVHAASNPTKRLCIPGTSSTSVASPTSPLDSSLAKLAPGQVPSSTSALLDPRLSLQLSSVATALGYWLWDDAQYKPALECMEMALSLLSLLDDTSLSTLPSSTLYHARSSRLLLSARTASLYLWHHSTEMEAKAAYECDLRVLQRARDLFVQTVRLQGDGAAVGRDPSGEDPHPADADDVVESLLKPPPLPSCLCTGLPAVSSALFSACLCDALVLAYTGGFHARVLCTPPLLVTSLRLSPLFFNTAECKFLRQTYGLLQLSSSAPVRLLEHPNAPTSSPEEQYRRLLLTMWGNEIINEFITLLTRFVYHKRGLPQPPPPLSPTSAARERGEEGKVHPLVLMGGLVKDETEELSQGPDVEGIDGQSMQLLLKVKRIMKHNVAQPGFRYVHHTH